MLGGVLEPRTKHEPRAPGPGPGREGATSGGSPAAERARNGTEGRASGGVGRLLLAAMAGLAIGCSKEEPAPVPTSASPSSAERARPDAPAADEPERPAEPSEPPAPLPEVRTLLELPQSAYGTSLHLGEDATYLLTATAVHRVPNDPELAAADDTPPRSLPLGAAAIVHDGEILYWSDEALRTTKLEGGPSTVIAEVPTEIREIAAGEGGLAWVRQDEQGGYLIEARGATEPLLRAKESLTSLVAIRGGVAVVRSGSGPGYHLVHIAFADRRVTESEPIIGRTPSMMVAHDGNLYYYDGPGRAVRRVPGDLQEGRPISKGTICSPIAVGRAVFCAEVGGVYAIDESTGQARAVSPETNGFVAAIEAVGDRVAWVTDTGNDGLVVRSSSRPGA